MVKLGNLKPYEMKVLSRLEENARVSFSSIGKKMRKSQQQVSYTVQSLISRGIIQGFRMIIDYSKLDVMHFRVYFKLSYVNEKKVEELISYLSSDIHTGWVATCGGSYDLICTFLASNPSQFNKTLRRVMEKFPAELQNYMVLTTVVNRRFGRKYLTDKIDSEQIIFGGDRDPESLDEIDMQLLNALSEDARRSSVSLGRKLKVSPKTVLDRLRKLEKRKVIRGYRSMFNAEAAGFYGVLLFIRYHNVSVGLEEKFVQYLIAHPNVVRLTKTLGEWDVEIHIETEKMVDFRKVEMELRRKFAGLIQRIDSLSLYDTFKQNTFPQFLVTP